MLGVIWLYYSILGVLIGGIAVVMLAFFVIMWLFAQPLILMSKLCLLWKRWRGKVIPKAG